jgi:DNA-binding CsgD family transcriptional regulator
MVNLASVTFDEREVLRLYQEGYTIKEIAVKTGHREKTVDSLLYSAKRKLEMF